MKSNTCPKCGSVKRERGQLFTVGSNWDVRFKSDTASLFSSKEKLVALACSSCGYVELYLADYENADAA